MKCCDICGAEPEYLYDLLESHRTRHIKHVCNDCRLVLDKHKSKLQAVTTNIFLDWFKSFAANLKASHQEKLKEKP